MMLATNMLPKTNAVTCIEFNGNKLKYKTVAKNFKNYVGGGTTIYTPIFNNDWVGYSQNRGFTLLNIKTKKCRYYSIAGDTNLLIIDIHVIDSDKWIFLFTIKVIPSGADPNPKYINILRMMDLSTPDGIIIAEKIISNKIGVSNHKDTVFLTENNTVKAYNGKLEEIKHPLVDAFNEEYKYNNKISQLTVHPYLPFAVFGFDTQETYRLFLIQWCSDDDTQKVFDIIDDGYFFKFSYDGKWLRSICNVLGKEAYIIFPVNKDLPHYLGSPIYLGNVPSFPSGEGSSAMTRNPSGLVVSDCSNTDEFFLKKWDFTEAEKLIEKK